jgi:hypothetical protein
LSIYIVWADVTINLVTEVETATFEEARRLALEKPLSAKLPLAEMQPRSGGHRPERRRSYATERQGGDAERGASGIVQPDTVVRGTAVGSEEIGRYLGTGTCPPSFNYYLWGSLKCHFLCWLA